MSPTFVFSCLPPRLKEQLSVIQSTHFPGVSLVFVDSFSDLCKYFSREEPYDSRNHPAPHLAGIYATDTLSGSDICGFLKNSLFRNPPILLMGKDMSSPDSLAKADLPFSGILDLSDESKQNSLLTDMIEYWSTVVKLPLV